VQALEKRELLAGDLEFKSPNTSPYQIIEGDSLTGQVKLAASTASSDIQVQLRIDQATNQASFSSSVFTDTKVITIAAGNDLSTVFTVSGWVDSIADGDHGVSLVATASGYSDLSVAMTILDADGNAPPEIVALDGLGFENGVLPGETVSLVGQFEDLNPADTHQVTVDWGDGTIQTLTAAQVDQVADSFSAGHVYDEAGLYEVAVTVADSADSDTERVDAAIVGIGLSDEGVLGVVGTVGDDRVEVRKACRGRVAVSVRLDGVDRQYRSYKASDVASLNIVTGDGQDRVKIHKKIKIMARIDVGAGHDVVKAGDGDTTVMAGAGNDIVITRRGNDSLHGGTGDDVLAAGDGDDLVDGGTGFNILVGGRGTDVMISSGEDIVIGGSLRDQTKVRKLAKLMSFWNSGDAFEDRVAVIREKFIDKRKGRHGHHRHHHHHGRHGEFVRDDKETDIFQNVDPAQRQWFFADDSEDTGADSQDIVS